MKQTRVMRLRQRGFTILEGMVACFTVLVCALIFASAYPVANKSRGKAQYANVAMSIAQREMEAIKAHGFSNADGNQLLALGLIDSITTKDLNAEVLYSNASTSGFEFTNIDSVENSSTKNLLPNGRAFVTIQDDTVDLRRVEVLVFWSENSEWKFVKLTTYLANL